MLPELVESVFEVAFGIDGESTTFCGSRFQSDTTP